MAVACVDGAPVCLSVYLASPVDNVDYGLRIKDKRSPYSNVVFSIFLEDNIYIWFALVCH